MRSMYAVRLDWRPKRTAHVRVATALLIMVMVCIRHAYYYYTYTGYSYHQKLCFPITIALCRDPSTRHLDG